MSRAIMSAWRPAQLTTPLAAMLSLSVSMWMVLPRLATCSTRVFRRSSPPISPKSVRVRLAHAAVVDDTRLRRPDGLDSRGVRLDLPQALAANELQPLHAVGLAAREEVVQARDLRLVPWRR